MGVRVRMGNSRGSTAVDFTSILITGGAGFVGSNLAIRFRASFSDLTVVALDNLTRRGSELNISRLGEAGVQFVHGDIRCPEDLDAVPEFDLLIDCSAEPSVHAGSAGSPRYVLNTNLCGTMNCAEAARERGAALLFLSTSRVYPIRPLNDIPFREDETRFRWIADDAPTGCSEHGVSESFTVDGARSYYGASKLAAEIILQEYAFNHGMKVLIDRCGILTGPWQMGKVDQGVVTLWVARHVYGVPLQYIGFGGTGKQVRDLLHIDDLFELLVRQCDDLARWNGEVYNVGGGPDISVSLLELTDLCQSITGERIPISSVPATSEVDVRLYLTDTRKVGRDFAWKPRRRADEIIFDIHHWLVEHRASLEPIFGPDDRPE